MNTKLATKNIYDNLNTLIAEYSENKAKENALKKQNTSDGKKIKDSFYILNINSFTAGNYTASISYNTRETLLEDKLIELLKANEVDIDGLIKTKEYVDMDVLESAIYNEKISQDIIAQMDSCKEVTKTEVLRIKKAKGG